jgi:hypothetical protein
VRVEPALGSWWSACTWTKGQTACDKGKGRGRRKPTRFSRTQSPYTASRRAGPHSPRVPPEAEPPAPAAEVNCGPDRHRGGATEPAQRPRYGPVSGLRPPARTLPAPGAAGLPAHPRPAGTDLLQLWCRAPSKWPLCGSMPLRLFTERDDASAPSRWPAVSSGGVVGFEPTTSAVTLLCWSVRTAAFVGATQCPLRARGARRRWSRSGRRG